MLKNNRDFLDKYGEVNSPPTVARNMLGLFRSRSGLAPAVAPKNIVKLQSKYLERIQEQSDGVSSGKEGVVLTSGKMSKSGFDFLEAAPSVIYLATDESNMTSLLPFFRTFHTTLLPPIGYNASTLSSTSESSEKSISGQGAGTESLTDAQLIDEAVAPPPLLSGIDLEVRLLQSRLFCLWEHFLVLPLSRHLITELIVAGSLSFTTNQLQNHLSN